MMRVKCTRSGAEPGWPRCRHHSPHSCWPKPPPPYAFPRARSNPSPFHHLTPPAPHHQPCRHHARLPSPSPCPPAPPRGSGLAAVSAFLPSDRTGCEVPSRSERLLFRHGWWQRAGDPPAPGLGEVRAVFLASPQGGVGAALGEFGFSVKKSGFWLIAEKPDFRLF
jgi:hypothetical protein